MLQLIKKDILFNWKWAAALVIVAILTPVVLFADREETRFTLWVYVIGTMLANSHFVLKSCYLDDGAPTRRFLASLPVSRAQLVASKYLLGLLCVAVTLFMTTLSSFALGFHPSIQGIQIASIYLLLYYAVFLGVFFRTNYSGAEKANTSLLMLTLLSAFVMDRSGADLDAIIPHPVALSAGLGMCMLAFAASLLISIRASGSFRTGDGK